MFFTEASPFLYCLSTSILCINSIFFFRVLLCHNHVGQSLKFYCEDCETAICASCTDIGHRDHFTKRMAEAVEQEKVELRALVDGAYIQVHTFLHSGTYFSRLCFIMVIYFCSCYRQARRIIVNETSKISRRHCVQTETRMKQKSWFMIGLICLLLLRWTKCVWH